MGEWIERNEIRGKGKEREKGEESKGASTLYSPRGSFYSSLPHLRCPCKPCTLGLGMRTREATSRCSQYLVKKESSKDSKDEKKERERERERERKKVKGRERGRKRKKEKERKSEKERERSGSTDRLIAEAIAIIYQLFQRTGDFSLFHFYDNSLSQEKDGGEGGM